MRSPSPARPARRVRGLAAAAGAAILLLASAAPAAAGGLGLDADAESGTVAPAWTKSAAARVIPAAAHSGEFGYEIDAKAEPGYLWWAEPAARKHVAFSVRTWVRIESRAPGQSVDLVTVTNDAGVNQFNFFLTANSSRFKWDLLDTDSAQSDFEVVPERWYLVEVHGEYEGGEYTASVRIDGRPQRSIESRSQRPSFAKALWLGTSEAKTHRQWYDDVRAHFSDSPVGHLGDAGLSAELTNVSVAEPAGSAASNDATSRRVGALVGIGLFGLVGLYIAARAERRRSRLPELGEPARR